MYKAVVLKVTSVLPRLQKCFVFSSSTSLPFWLSEYPQGAADDCSKEEILPKNFLSSRKGNTEFLNNRSIRLRNSELLP